MMMKQVLMMGLWLQDVGSLSSGNSQLLMIFVGIAAAALLMLAIAFVILAVIAAKLSKAVTVTIDEVKAKSLPAIVSANAILQDLTPKVRVISANLVETSHLVRAKVQEFDSTLTDVNETIKDANQKTHVQVGRVDSMVTSTLARTAALADTIHNSIRKPVNEVAGMVNGFKAGLDVLMSRAKDFGGPRGPRY
jgi:uncharacterized protein YoxC